MEVRPFLGKNFDDRDLDGMVCKGGEVFRVSKGRDDVGYLLSSSL